ncbi:hypothetical protein [Sphaerothrix gracilis]|uniref:hypothetical protein n=1 Tax=Sphaerothrix gracilis TaxID=3151835 RepID=UPI0031FDC732
MLFWSYGPFEVDLENRRDFWKTLNEWEDYDELPVNSLKCAFGCYSLVMRRGEKYKPWYVGKAHGKDGFKQEIFADHKLKHYRNIIAQNPGWRPYMLLFPLVTPRGCISKSVSTRKPDILWMERTLIAMALARNPNLFNVRDTKNYRNFVLDGVLGPYQKRQKYDAADVARRTFTHFED